MKKYRLPFIFLFFILTLALIWFAVEFYAHEKWQNKQIQYLQQQIDLLTSENLSPVQYDADAFNYLAIGNSITIHAVCDYWWNEIGMAASTAQKDYFHLVNDYLQAEHDNLISYAYNFSIWETQNTDRTQTVNNLTNYLSPELDLITIQLSENAENLDTFAVDLKELIEILRETCPAAQIILIDDFWSSEKSELKKQVANELGVPFASLCSIRGNEEYMAGLNTTVYDGGGALILSNTAVLPHTLETKACRLLRIQ